MSHLTKVKTSITDRELVIKTIKHLGISPVELDDKISFTHRAYGKNWKISFTETSEGFTFNGESDFYSYHFLPGYIYQVIYQKMSQVAQFTGKLIEVNRSHNNVGGMTVIYKSEMGQTINFVIDAETNIEVKTEGFTGTNCLSATTGIMTALGSIENQAITVTPDAPDLLNQISY